MKAPSLRPQSRLQNLSCSNCNNLIPDTGHPVPSVSVSAASPTFSRSQMNGVFQDDVFSNHMGSRRNLVGILSCNCSACDELPGSAAGGMAGATNNRCSTTGYEVLENHSGPGDAEEDKIKGKLNFFFLNPVDKYLASKRLPWKFCLQILKVFLVTAQLWIFADFRFSHTTYYANQEVTMHHLFIKDWDQAREINAYPPATGKLALYSKLEFMKFLDYAVANWASVENSSLAPFFRNSDLWLCVQHYGARNITRDLTFTPAQESAEQCIRLQADQADKFNTSTEWMEDNHFTVHWHVMERLFLNFSLTSINLSPSGLHPDPECYQFPMQIMFDNTDHDGQVPVYLDVEPACIQCSSDIKTTSSFYSQFIMFFNLLVILLCTCSLFLCLRSILRAELLKYETEHFLGRNYDMALTFGEKLEFLNLWYVMICINDCLIIAGSSIKLVLEMKKIASEYLWDHCSMMLGTGDLLVWIGLLRYLGFFKTYNVLILTMKGAAPNIFRFLICAAMVYIGFVFAGWAILGPYNFKFASLMSTSECLFSLINGDDMYATYNFVHFNQSPSVWIYSRVYLYSFICLFIYLVLSLFISIIMDTYEIIKRDHQDWVQLWLPTELEQFYNSGDPEHPPGVFSGESSLDRLFSIIRRTWNYNYQRNYGEME